MNSDLQGVKRSIPVAVILSIVTCVIYAWYWLYKMLDDHYRLSGQESKAGVDILLSFVTCGIYYIYLVYKLGKLESATFAAYGKPPKDDSILYLILGLFGLWIVTYCIVQSNLNKLADEHDGGVVSQQ